MCDESDSVKRTFDILLRQLSTQYNLLLGYRALFITINTFLLPFSLKFLTMGSHQSIFSLLLSLAGFALCVLWYKSTEFRRHNVFFIEREILKFESQGKPSPYNAQAKLINWQHRTHEYRKNECQKGNDNIEEMKLVHMCPGSKLMNGIRTAYFFAWSGIFILSSTILITDNNDLYNYFNEKHQITIHEKRVKYVALERINLRSLPSLSSSVITVLEKGQNMDQLDMEKNWLNIEYFDLDKNEQLVGWISSRYVTKK